MEASSAQSRRPRGQATWVLLAMIAALAASATPAFAREAVFRWRDPVRCGPFGTLRFDAGAVLVLPDTGDGYFEFRGEAREESRRREAYVVTLTFLDWNGRLLFRLASEPFEMDPGRRTRFLILGHELRVARFWDAIAAVELDAQVPFEPLFEDAWDFYGYVLRYARDQRLEAREFR